VTIHYHTSPLFQVENLGTWNYQVSLKFRAFCKQLGMLTDQPYLICIHVTNLTS